MIIHETRTLFAWSVCAHLIGRTILSRHRGSLNIALLLSPLLACYLVVGNGRQDLGNESSPVAVMATAAATVIYLLIATVIVLITFLLATSSSGVHRYS